MVFCLQVRFSLITGVCVWPRTSFAATTGEDLLHLKLSSVMERSKLSALPSEQWCTSQQTFYNSKKTKWLRLAKRSAADPLFQVEAKQLSEWHVPFLTCQLSLTAEASLSESTLSSTSSWAKRQPARYTENWDGATCMFSNLFFLHETHEMYWMFRIRSTVFLDPRVGPKSLTHLTMFQFKQADSGPKPTRVSVTLWHSAMGSQSTTRLKRRSLRTQT